MLHIYFVWKVECFFSGKHFELSVSKVEKNWPFDHMVIYGLSINRFQQVDDGTEWYFPTNMFLNKNS